MPQFSSVAAFRAAVAKAATANPRRARPNMATRLSASGELEFDTPEEAAAYMRAMGSAAARPPVRGPARPPVKPAKKSRKTGPALVQEAAARPYMGPKDPSGPPTFGTAKAIGISIGGLAAYCPSLVGLKVEGGAHVQALQKLGLTAASALAVRQAMEDAGVLYAKTPGDQARARLILEQVGGVSCPVR